MIEKIKQVITGKKKWKIYFYLYDQCIAKKIIEDTKHVYDKTYVVRSHKKCIFKSYNAKVVLKPFSLLYQDNDKKEVHVACTFVKGMMIDGA